MVGMAEWQNGRMAGMAGMADGMVNMVGMAEWQECRTEWSNGRNGYIRTIYADGMVKMVRLLPPIVVLTRVLEHLVRLLQPILLLPHVLKHMVLHV
jgi:hypothetical protein